MAALVEALFQGEVEQKLDKDSKIAHCMVGLDYACYICKD